MNLHTDECMEKKSNRFFVSVSEEENKYYFEFHELLFTATQHAHSCTNG